MLPGIVVLALLSQPQPGPGRPELSAKQKQIDALISDIRQLAVSEPVVFGIDTRLKLVNALPASYSKPAANILQDDESELAGVATSAEQSALRVQIAAAWAKFDLEQAQRAIQPLRSGSEHDYIAEAYDQLYLIFEQQPVRARGLISDGLKAGAFRMISASRLLEGYATSHNRAAAIALFSEILAAFPLDPSFPADIRYLLDQATQIVSVNRDLALQAVDVALRAADSEQANREGLFRSIAAQLRAIDPALLKRYANEYKDLAPPPMEAQTTENPKPEDQKTADLSGLSYSNALTQARAIEPLIDRIGALIELSRREDFTTDQRTSVASEALHSSEKCRSA